jgi:uncharacterized peroxidase-related enzyme
VAWIKTIEREEASTELAEAYETVAGERGTVSNILKVHSISPRTMLAHLGLYKELMFGRSELTRSEREMIAVVVSVTNGCHY